MQSQLNMSLVMALPLKKRPVRIDFSNIEELANISPSKRCKRESVSDCSRSGRSSADSSSGSTLSDAASDSVSPSSLPFNPFFYHPTAFLPIHASTSYSFASSPLHFASLVAESTGTL